MSPGELTAGYPHCIPRRVWLTSTAEQAPVRATPTIDIATRPPACVPDPGTWPKVILTRQVGRFWVKGTTHDPGRTLHRRHLSAGVQPLLHLDLFWQGNCILIALEQDRPQLASLRRIPGGPEPFVGDAQPGGLLLQPDMQGDAPQDRQIRRCLLPADPASLFRQGYILPPGHGVFDAPVSPYRRQQGCGPGRRAGDVVTHGPGLSAHGSAVRTPP